MENIAGSNKRKIIMLNKPFCIEEIFYKAYLKDWQISFIVYLEKIIIYFSKILYMEKVILSPMEKRILKYLSLKGFTPEATIAKELGINKSTIHYKLKKLIERGIIKGYRYRMNYNKLGFATRAWLLLRIEPSIEISLFADELLKIPHIHAAYFLTGEEDLALRVAVKDLNELSGLVISLEKRFKEIIRSIKTLIVSKEFKRHQIVLNEEHFKPVKLSNMDLNILSYFRENPNKRLGEAARELKIHRNTLSLRWKKLIEEKVILKKSVEINPLYWEDVDIDFKALVLFDAKTAEATELAKKLINMQEVHELEMISTHFDLLAVVRTANLKTFYSFNRKIFSNEDIRKHINRTSSIIVMFEKERLITPIEIIYGNSSVSQ